MERVDPVVAGSVARVGFVFTGEPSLRELMRGGEVIASAEGDDGSGGWPVAIRFAGRDGAASPGPGHELELVVRAGSGARGGVAVELWYDPGLFDAGTAARLLGHVATLVEEAWRSPDRAVARLRLLGDAELERMLVAWNATACDLPSEVCLHEGFEAQVRRAPDAVAVVQGQDRYSYRQVNAAANRVARYLRERGVGPDVRVGVCLDRSVDLLVAVLGVLKAGGAYVPLDPDYPAQRIATMVTGTACAVMISREGLTANLPDTGDGSDTGFGAGATAEAAGAGVVDGAGLPRAGAGGDGGRLLLLDRDTALLAAQPDDDLGPTSGPEDLCYIIHTSGSTGEPKPIALRHRGVMNNLADLNTRFQVGPWDAVLALSSPSFDMSVYEFLGLTIAGGRVVIPEASHAKDPAHWAQLLTREHITIWNSAPALLGLLIDHLEQAGLGSAAGENAPPGLALRLVLLGGDWVPVPLPGRVRVWAAQVRFVVMGGATEASIHSTIFEVDRVDPSWRSIPYGRPMANQRVYILDGSLRPVPPGVAGELYLAGVGLARGYLGRPEQTAERFIDDWSYGPVVGERLYRTGDVARFGADGLVELLGRADFQVKINGLRVELGEIEAVLRAHQSVAQVAVMARQGRLAAYIVPATSTEVDVENLRAYAATRLPAFMVPAAFVVMERLPLTPNGKLDRGGLPDPRLGGTGTGYRAPRSAVEKTLAQVLAHVLEVERVGLDDEFIALGGDSIRAIQLTSRARAYGLHITAKQVLQSRTLADLAASVTDTATEPAAIGGAVAVVGKATVGDAPVNGTAAGNSHGDDGDPGGVLSGDGIPGGDGRGSGPLVEVSQEDMDYWGQDHPHISDVWPVTPLQAGMLFESMLNDSGHDAYHLQTVYHLSGEVDPVRMRAAAQAVLERHPNLRVAFVEDELGDTVQIVVDGVELPWKHLDLGELAEDERDEAFRRFLAEDEVSRFAPGTAPLLRMTLVRLGPGRTALVLTIHHVLIDGWSEHVLGRDLVKLYAADGDASALPPARPYRDFLAWLSRQDREASAKAWAEELAGVDGPTTVLPALAAPRAAAEEAPGGVGEVVLPVSVADARAYGRRCAELGVTLNTLVQGAWAVLVSALTGREDVVFGAVVSGRPGTLAEVDGMVGLFINTIPVRVRRAPDATVAELLTGLQARQIALLDHHHHSLGEIQRAAGFDTLFDTLVAFQSYLWNREDDAGAGGVELTGVDSIGGNSYPLTLVVEAGRMILQYQRHLLDQDTAERVAAGFRSVLDQMASDPARRLGTLEVPPPDGR
ncbi:non-ribosomal peptide synthetase [Sphaerisporangium siamense]|uniref:Amino acid adenylation domain-containing protein n=1 Tax=Sphaerisporangium siamense TaxID=795645 RepID=A0A7W7G864_9ACTN|nr:non-ribosomal peptide synthetase [Sphaerisporangium siamense]MBB4699249.1 amino acid adenylation domain-containing protein [Sphaerisporangium siamense]